MSRAKRFLREVCIIAVMAVFGYAAIMGVLALSLLSAQSATMGRQFI